MAYEKTGYLNKSYTVDDVSDLNSLKNLNMGSSAKVISTGDTYIINSKGEWIKQPNAHSPITATTLSGNINLQQINEVYYHGGNNLFDAEGCSDYFYDYDGSIIEARDGRVMSNYIICKPGQKITRNGNLTNVVCYFDANKNFLIRKDSKNLSTLTVPENPLIAYVRMAVVVSPDLKIVYGTMINENAGDYYTIPKLKITENNLEENSLGYYTSPNGAVWKIIIGNNGEISSKMVSSPPSSSSWPENFLTYTCSGEMTDNTSEILLTPQMKAATSYLFSIDYQGNLKRYKKLDHGASNFKAVRYVDGTIRYYYLKIIERLDNSYWRSTLTILDKDWNVVVEDLDSPFGHPINGHGGLVFSDDHYVLVGSPHADVTNIPGYEGQIIQLQDMVIQEIKNGKVIWDWSITDYPELYNICRYYQKMGNWDAQLAINSPEKYLDFAHFNSIAVDRKTGDYLVSLRYIGLIKIDKATKKIKWVLSKYRNDFGDSIAKNDICYLQHDAKYHTDNSITVFDNNEVEVNRVCRYWINEEDMTVTDSQVFYTNKPTCNNYGGATILHQKNNTYLLTYGDPNTITLEEYCFDTNTSNFQLSFDVNEVYTYIAFPLKDSVLDVVLPKEV